MIEQIKQGTNRATINYTKDGVSVHFSKNANPKFVAQVGQMIDEFIWSKEDEAEITDTFERKNNA